MKTEVKVTYLAAQIEAIIENSEVFENATAVEQIDMLEDLAANLKRWRDKLYDKWDNENN